MSDSPTRIGIVWICCACLVISGAGFNLNASPAAAIGWIAASGDVDVRNVRVRETTVFSGDRVRVFPKSGATMVLDPGHRIELAGDTNVRIASEGPWTTIDVDAGRLDFSASLQGRIRVQAQSLLVSAESSEAGRVASVQQDIVAVAALKGELHVLNRETGETFSVKAGNTAVFGLRGKEPLASDSAEFSGERASAQQQPPAGTQPPATVRVPRTDTQSAVSSNTKLFLILGIGGAAAVTTILLTRDDSPASPSSP
jgi:hypothetical protein